MSEIVASICRAALGESPASVRPIVGDGVVNAVFGVETRRGQLIFRVQVDVPFDGAFRKEAWCMERAREAGVPVPDWVAIGVHGAHAYAIHRKLPGVTGSRYRGDLGAVWRRIGRHARRFHDVEALGFGEHVGGRLAETDDATLAGWVSWWDARIFGTPLLVDRGLLPALALDRARARLSEIAAWEVAPRLCHGNLSLENVIVDPGGEVSILDWGTAAGHLAPQLDLAELHVWSADPEPAALAPFLEGYGLPRREYDAMREPIARLALWRILSSAHWLLSTGRARPGVVELLRAKLGALLGDGLASA